MALYFQRYIWPRLRAEQIGHKLATALPVRQQDVYNVKMRKGRRYHGVGAYSRCKHLSGIAMEKLRVYYDREGNTLSVWFDDPKKESVCEEADDDVILVKDSDGRVIGFERLNYLTAKQHKDGVNISVEVQMV